VKSTRCFTELAMSGPFGKRSSEPTYTLRGKTARLLIFHLASPFYLWLTVYMAHSVVNKFAARCSCCGQQVAPGQGISTSPPAGSKKWDTKHTLCPNLDITPVIPASRKVNHPPTVEQLQAIKLALTFDDLVIQAGAGAGKTTVLRMIAEEMDKLGRTIVYTAFNKSIVTSSSGSFGGNVTCSTIHSLARQSLDRALLPRLDAHAMRFTQISRLLPVPALVVEGEDGTKTLGTPFLVSLALRTIKEFCKSADEAPTVDHVPSVKGLDEAGNSKVASYILPYALTAWEDLKSVDGQIPWRNAGWQAIYVKMWQLDSPRIYADVVCVDEAQDMSAVMRSIALQQKQYGTQLIAVGDSFQSINGWMGAVDALASLEATGANVTYLTQSFRFGNAVADVANGLLAKLGAPLRISGFGKVSSTVGPVSDPDAILTRTNAGALRTVLAAIQAGRKPHLVGGGTEVSKFAEAARNLQEIGYCDHPELGCLGSWGEVQAHASGDEGQEIAQMVKLIDDFGVEVVLQAVANEITADKADLVVTTAHKSKGLEWNSVQLAGDFFTPKKGQGPDPEELKLLYVAVTRAKVELDITAVSHLL
jgi:hypothetical protein